MRFRVVAESVPERAALDMLIRTAFGPAAVEAVEPGGWGNIGFGQRVTLSREPRTVIVKWQKYAGLAVKEAQQLERVVAEFGSLDVLVNNAGIDGEGPLQRGGDSPPPARPTSGA